MTIAEHLQEMHGLDVDGEWRYAPDHWRNAHMTDAALWARHHGLHADEDWNEASERHVHEYNPSDSGSVRTFLDDALVSGVGTASLDKIGTIPVVVYTFTYPSLVPEGGSWCF